MPFILKKLASKKKRFYLFFLLPFIIISQKKNASIIILGVKSCCGSRIRQLQNQFRSMQNSLLSPLNLLSLVKNCSWWRPEVAHRIKIFNGAECHRDKIICEGARKNGFELKSCVWAVERRVEHPRGHKHAHRLPPPSAERLRLLSFLMRRRTSGGDAPL